MFINMLIYNYNILRTICSRNSDCNSSIKKDNVWYNKSDNNVVEGQYNG